MVSYFRYILSDEIPKNKLLTNNNLNRVKIYLFVIFSQRIGVINFLTDVNLFPVGRARVINIPSENKVTSTNKKHIL